MNRRGARVDTKVIVQEIHSSPLALSLAVSIAVFAGCGSPDETSDDASPRAGGSTGASPSGGTPASGGAAASGGTAGTGGIGLGGGITTGGNPATGGVARTGGAPSTGGRVSTGGASVTDRSMCPTNDACEPPPKLVDPEGWANLLVQFIATMEEAGVPVYAISAYANPAEGTVVVVAINQNSNATPVALFISDAAPCTVTPG